MTAREFLIYNLKNLLSTIIENEKMIDDMRSYLYKNTSFDYTTLCKIIDNQNSCFITKNSLCKFLSFHSNDISLDLLSIFFNYFADDWLSGQKSFTYNGFQNFLYPKLYISSRMVKTNSKNTRNYFLEKKVCEIIIYELALIQEISLLLDNFYKDDNFSIYDIIRFLNNNKFNIINEDYITSISLEKFCLKFGIHLNHNELKLLLQYLKADSCNKITYTQLKFLFRNFIFNPNKINLIKDYTYLHSKFASVNLLKAKSSNSQEIKIIKEITLIDFITNFLKYEYDLYLIKGELYSSNDFIPIELFYLFDINDNNFISVNDFINVLSNNFNIKATLEEANIIFFNYAKKNTSLIFYENFRKLLLPFNCLSLPDKKIDPKVKNITPETKAKIITFFQKLLSIEKEIDNLKVNFFNKKNFSSYGEFIKLKGKMYKTQYINKQMFINYLIQNLKCDNNEIEKKINLKILDPLFYRIDEDGDLLISNEDFINFITPFNSNI